MWCVENRSVEHVSVNFIVSNSPVLLVLHVIPTNLLVLHRSFCKFSNFVYVFANKNYGTGKFSNRFYGTGTEADIGSDRQTGAVVGKYSG